MGAESLEVDRLLSLLHEANNRTKAVVWTGWSMFFPFNPKEIRPRVRVSSIANAEKEFLESDLTMEGGGYLDFWRFSTDGLATLIRGYREDSGNSRRAYQEGLVPGACLSPIALAQDVTEFISHAIAMAEILDVQSIELRFSLVGLKDRKIAEFSWQDRIDPHVSVTDSRQVTKVIERVAAKAELPKLVAETINPVLRLFDGLQVDENWIRNQMQKFKQL